jgi:hypothetical protein
MEEKPVSGKGCMCAAVEVEREMEIGCLLHVVCMIEMNNTHMAVVWRKWIRGHNFTENVYKEQKRGLNKLV